MNGSDPVNGAARADGASRAEELVEAPAQLVRRALLSFAVVAVIIAVSMRVLDIEVAFIGHLGSAVVAITLLYTPVFVCWRRGEDLVSYGFTTDPVARSLFMATAVLLVVVPLFTAGYVFFYQEVCDSASSLHNLGVPGVCARFAGWSGAVVPHLDMQFGELVLIQLVVVALPEELFFRGFLHQLLERAIPPKRRILGGGVGWALIISSALFALIHLPKHGDPRALATFFPGLLFGWLRSATGSILASTVTHASSNLLVNLLQRVFLR